MIPVLTLALVIAAAPAAPMPPCLRLARAGTQVQGSVTVCPGRYRIADPTEMGVLIVASSGTRIDLTGVTLESGDTSAPAFVGNWIASRGVDNVEIYGGVVRGYRYGIRLEGGRGHRITRWMFRGRGGRRFDPRRSGMTSGTGSTSSVPTASNRTAAASCSSSRTGRRSRV
jgi:hypothetical protein